MAMNARSAQQSNVDRHGKAAVGSTVVYVLTQPLQNVAPHQKAVTILYRLERTSADGFAVVATAELTTGHPAGVPMEGGTHCYVPLPLSRPQPLPLLLVLLLRAGEDGQLRCIRVAKCERN